MPTTTVQLPTPDQVVLASQSRSLTRCVTLTATVLFVLINITCALMREVQDHSTEAYKNCAFLLGAFEKASPRPNIILLGSSLMKMPFFQYDRNHSKYIPDDTHYCCSQTLQNILRANGLKSSIVFNFSTAGAMVSDQFLINKKLLDGSKAPEWIVFGIAPRDFMDNLLSKETRTEVFNQLISIEDIWSPNSFFETTFNERLKLTLEKICSLYNNRSQLQGMLADKYYDVLALLLSMASSEYHKFDRGKNVDILQKHSQLNTPLSSSPMSSDARTWRISITEYSRRYKRFNKKQFERQDSFLKAFCGKCQQKGIKLLLVNMPLTRENIDLMPPGSYDAYRKAILECRQLPGVTLLDAQNLKEFDETCFVDTAHLNTKGAHLLSMLISDVLVSNQRNNAVPAKLPITDALPDWWLRKAYFAEPKPPDIVVLGGSQLGALLGADAYVYNRLVDLTGNHRSYTIEHDLKLLLHKNWHILTAALPEATISDQLATSRTLFSNHYKPKMVAVVFSPGDFTDPHAVANLPYHYSQPISALTLGNPFERICPGEIAIGSGDGYYFNDDLKKYKRLYLNIYRHSLIQKMQSLEALFHYLKQLQIKAIAIEMPLTYDNRTLLPQSFWKYYNQKIAATCRKYDVDWWDTRVIWSDFDKGDFCGSANLNLRGGLKLTRPIVLGTACKLHLPLYGYNGNAGPLVPQSKKSVLQISESTKRESK